MRKTYFLFFFSYNLIFAQQIIPLYTTPLDCDIEKKDSEKLQLIIIEQPPSIKKLIFDPQRVNYLIRK